jgi:hypothetical protein
MRTKKSCAAEVTSLVAEYGFQPSPDSEEPEQLFSYQLVRAMKAYGYKTTHLAF